MPHVRSTQIHFQTTQGSEKSVACSMTWGLLVQRIGGTAKPVSESWTGHHDTQTSTVPPISCMEVAGHDQ